MSNILPYNHKKFIHQIRVLRLATATMWALVILIVAAGLLLVPQLVVVRSHYSIALDQIAQLERAGAVVDPVDIAALEARVGALSTKLAAPVSPAPTAYITAVRAVVVSGITLSGFSTDEGAEAPTLEVSGISASREALRRFVEMLEKTDGVASVDSPVSNYVKSVSSPFQISVTFKPV
jgi:Tfp pilus assembly protein PilN